MTKWQKKKHVKREKKGGWSEKQKRLRKEEGKQKKYGVQSAGKRWMSLWR